MNFVADQVVVQWVAESLVLKSVFQGADLAPVGSSLVFLSNSDGRTKQFGGCEYVAPLSESKKGSPS